MGVSRGVLVAGAVLVALLLTGCVSKESEMLGAPVEGYNHTSAAINRFTVNGAGGLIWGLIAVAVDRYVVARCRVTGDLD